jgi:hypothetical protein
MKGYKIQMTKRIGNTIIIEQTANSKCELCGKIAETRPYGPHGENICFDCGMKNKGETKKALAKLFGDSTDN